MSHDQDVDMPDNPAQDALPADQETVDGKGSDVFELIHNLSRYLCSVEEDGEELAAGFQRIPNRRILPDYFDIILEPIAFSTIRSKIQKKQYSTFSEFVRDVAQICHNAQVYNRPSAPIFRAAERLREIFSVELEKLVAKGEISPQDTKLPDLGELPPAEESPSRASDNEDENGGYDDEGEVQDDGDDDGDDDDDDEELGGEEDGHQRKNRGRTSDRRGYGDDNDEDPHQRSGRPPIISTPLDARITSIIRGLKRPKDHDGNPLIRLFEKLPDRTSTPDYFTSISNPIALDQIKKKARRKKYKSVDEMMSDVELMFDNAQGYNEDDSEVHRAAVELRQEALTLAEQEKAKPDDDFRDGHGKLALAEISSAIDVWRVGDWVHIRNPNDLAKPIVAQIFRMWQDRAGQRWINVCWYYRPEQTVHRFEKHFFENEVVKTGRYRDHHIDEVIDRCFVMFVTRFNKGRPRGLPLNKDIYVCESRYNEDRFRFNKIKTWASCVPDEVRERDYEMDLFDVPRRMKKIPSPIKHLLREDAKETDQLPKPTWGSPNAPPIVGAVHRRPPEPNESPPPAITPPLAPVSMAPGVPPESVHRAPALIAARDSVTDVSARSTRGSFSTTAAAPSPGHGHPHPHPHMTPYQQLNPLHGGPTIHQTPVPIPHPPQQSIQPQVPIRPMQYQHMHQQPNYSQGYVANFAQSPVMQMQHPPMANSRASNYSQAHLAPASRPLSVATPPGASQPHANIYNPPRPPEIYTLPESANDAFPAEVRRGFQHDATGKVLFFTSAPLDRSTKGLSPASACLGHSIKYLAGREAWLEERGKKRKERDQEMLEESDAEGLGVGFSHGGFDDVATSQAAHAVGGWLRRLNEDTEQWEEAVGLKGWRNFDQTQSV